MHRKEPVIPPVTLIACLVLLPCSALAADPHEHDFRWVSSTPLADLPSAHLAESPGHGFDAWIAPDGVRARAVDGAWQVGLALVAVGRDGAMEEAAPAGVEARGNRAELHRGSLTEWYVNDERGLEQGFTLEERPAGAEGDELVLAMELTGNLMPLVAGNGRRLDLLRPGNPLPVLHYSGLTVVDAEGLELPARLELGAGTESGGRRLRIVVADADAVYPVVVDPLLTTAVWSSSELDDTGDVAWGDWDGDGDLDLAVGNGVANRVYENDGLGQPSSLTPVWASADTDDTASVAWGDWDGDGDLDLAAGNNGQPNRVYENDGLGQPGSLSSVWTSADTDYTMSVAWADWDGDGDLDLAAGNWSGANRVYENDGLGLPGSLASVWTSADTDYTASVAWGDWDGDGDLDLAAGNAFSANRVYSNDGFGQPGSLASVWTSAETETTRSVAWGDWDGDGDLDLAAGNDIQANRVYSNDGLGQPGSLTSVWTSAETETTRSVAWGDWDGDGDLDLAAGNNGQANRVYSNDGLGQPGSLTSAWTAADTDYTSSVAWGDWDGDGDLDLAAGNILHANRVYENGWLRRPGGLPETPVSPVLSDRPGVTDTAFFFSAAECLASPVSVEYLLTDEESDPALRIVPEYSVVGDAGWQPATEGPGGDGTTDLPADADGWEHVFVWDSDADSVLWGHNVVFRITVPHQASLHAGGPIQRGAMSAVSPPFRICDVPADISVTKDDAVTQVTLGQLLTYTITVSHDAGLADAPGVRVIDVFPSALSSVSWNCLEDGGGTCGTASGFGDIDTSVDLPVGTHVTFVAVGAVTAAGGDGVTNTVEVLASPVAPDPYLANNTATDVDRGWGGIFADGFESGDTEGWSTTVP